jgi:hypothetical protein
VDGRRVERRRREQAVSKVVLKEWERNMSLLRQERIRRSSKSGRSTMAFTSSQEGGVRLTVSVQSKKLKPVV